MWPLNCPNDLQVGAPKAHAYSWNTQINRYYGDDTRDYIARYDRVYMRGLEATAYQLVANEPRTEAGGQRWWWAGGLLRWGGVRQSSFEAWPAARAADGDQRGAQPGQVGREALQSWCLLGTLCHGASSFAAFLASCPNIRRRLPQRPLWPAVRAASGARARGQPPAQPRRGSSGGSKAAAAVPQRQPSGGGGALAGAAVWMTLDISLLQFVSNNAVNFSLSRPTPPGATQHGFKRRGAAASTAPS